MNIISKCDVLLKTLVFLWQLVNITFTSVKSSKVMNSYFLTSQAKRVVCDNHPSNLSASKKLPVQNKELENQLFFTTKGLGIIQLYYDTVHLMKNMRNNLLGRKSLIFPPFTSQNVYGY